MSVVSGLKGHGIMRGDKVSENGLSREWWECHAIKDGDELARISEEERPMFSVLAWDNGCFSIKINEDYLLFRF
ncbi:hypothetical protein JTE90_014151 [Oedothorax gibbosus]|uniref:Uncharacterized protein n=1 Tax=Oedothorax gibbosus TaxID=931172 RepID=A0AAV6VIF9_9ARAC|nr:hypothetical protein JTE90_014151 [Oedothorax gibbosus]